jgi:recombination protein RecA
MVAIATNKPVKSESTELQSEKPGWQQADGPAPRPATATGPVAAVPAKDGPSDDGASASANHRNDSKTTSEKGTNGKMANDRTGTGKASSDHKAVTEKAAVERPSEKSVAGGKTVARSGKKEKGEAAARMSALEQNANLKTALQQIEKQFGEGSIMPLGSASAVQIQGIPTGSLSLDIALGGQGIPRGRIIEIFGPESSGKTTLALHVVAQAQRSGGIAAFIDAEHAFDPSWARKLGVQLDTLLVSQPNTGEEAMQITEMLVKSNAVDIIVIDSVAALVPRQELEGEIGDAFVGLQARLMSQSLRKLTGAISRSKTAVIFINQIREKIGVMFGSPETTPGGRALKFYSSCRIDVRRIGQLKDGEEVVGQRVRTKVVKNKVAPPFRLAEFDMMHTHGISYEGDLLDLGVNHKILTRSGSWFKYGEIYMGQGKEKARQYLVENPKMAEEIRTKILALGATATVAAEPETDDADSKEDS